MQTHITRTTRTTLTLTAAALGIPLLVGCGGSTGTSDAAPSEAASASSAQAPSGSADQTMSESPAADATADATEGAQSGQPEASSAATAAPSDSAQAESGAVTDPCANECKETSRVPVKHRTLGDVEVVSYEKKVERINASPDQIWAAYAVYRDGKPLGYKEAEYTSEYFTPGQVGESPTFSVNNGTENMDRHGNLYYNYGTGLTVLSQNQKGFDSRGSLPMNPEGRAARFAGYTSLIIDSHGDPTLTVPDRNSGQSIEYTWQDGMFMKKR